MKYAARIAATFLLLTRSAVLAADTKAIVISIDGLKGTTLASIAQRKLRTPNLNEFVAKGAVSEGVEPVFPSVTYPNHTTIVTGRSPSAHGIFGNTLFDPEKKMINVWNWYAEQIRVPALWDRARAAGLKTASVNWPVTVGAAIDFNFPEHRIPRNIEDRMLFRALSTPGLAAEFEKAHGEIPVTPSRDELRARMAAFLIRTRRPDLLLIHFMDLDHAEHGSGPDGPSALKTLEEIDECIGVMRAAVRDSGVEPQTAWFIVSDHGFWPTAKALNPNAVLQSLGLAAPEGKPAEWRVASYGNGGSFTLYARSAADREAIELATKTFTRLHAEGTWGIGKVLTRQDLDRAKTLDGAFLAVSMASGYSAGYGSGAWLTTYEKPGGNHGFWPGPPELDASFAAFGKDIGAARLPRGKLLDVAPTVARILGFNMNGAEGRNLLDSTSARKH